MYQKNSRNLYKFDDQILKTENSDYNSKREPVKDN